MSYMETVGITADLDPTAADQYKTTQAEYKRVLEQFDKGDPCPTGVILGPPCHTTADSTDPTTRWCLLCRACLGKPADGASRTDSELFGHPATGVLLGAIRSEPHTPGPGALHYTGNRESWQRERQP